MLLWSNVIRLHGLRTVEGSFAGHRLQCRTEVWVSHGVFGEVGRQRSPTLAGMAAETLSADAGKSLLQDSSPLGRIADAWNGIIDSLQGILAWQLTGATTCAPAVASFEARKYLEQTGLAAVGEWPCTWEIRLGLTQDIPVGSSNGWGMGTETLFFGDSGTPKTQLSRRTAHICRAKTQGADSGPQMISRRPTENHPGTFASQSAKKDQMNKPSVRPWLVSAHAGQNEVPCWF